jgi:hypothetical protein
MSHLLVNGISRMVFEHLRDYFHLEDSMSGFLQLFQLCFHIAHGHIPLRLTRVLGTTYFLTMIKLSNGVCLIVVGETSYQFTSHTLCFQFHNAFVTHFPPHQFEVTTKGGSEAIIHGIKFTLDLHFD